MKLPQKIGVDCRVSALRYKRQQQDLLNERVNPAAVYEQTIELVEYFCSLDRLPKSISRSLHCITPLNSELNESGFGSAQDVMIKK